jgi:hypothetical protein
MPAVPWVRPFLYGIDILEMAGSILKEKMINRVHISDLLFQWKGEGIPGQPLS